MTITVIRPGQRVYSIGSRGVRISQPMGGAATPWFLSGGIAAANCLAAYAAKGAASLLASYDNLAAPGNGLPDGTYDAALGVAPTFNTATGWTFDGATQYLMTSIMPVIGGSVFIQFTGAVSVADYSVIFGEYDAGAYCYIHTRYALASDFVGYAGGPGPTVLVAPRLEAGNLGIAGDYAYRNGVTEGAALTSWLHSPAIRQIYLGGLNLADAYALGQPCVVRAFVYYNTTLTAPQITALTTAMAAL